MNFEVEKTIEAVKRRYRIIGNDRKLNEAIEIAVSVAPTEVSVLVLGESGTGKDIFGRIIHDLSHRRHKPYLAINCAAIPEGTLDSELFGHEKGAFTSAYESRKGYFEEANGGTLFLDEIGEMPLHTQARLLRVLESGEYFRVGSSKVRKTDVRIVAATNKNLLELIRKGKFREDLYYRLNTVSIFVPPLRERGEDIILLMEHYLMEFSDKYYKPLPELDESAKRLLLNYGWPGNVRELRNLAEKIIILAKRDIITGEELGKLYPNLVQSFLPVPVSEVYKDNFSEPKTEFYSQWDGTGDFENNYESPKPTNNYQVIRMLSYIRKDIQDMKKLLISGIITKSNDKPIALPEKNEPKEEILSLRENEKRLIKSALKKFYGNRKKAAQSLGISERTLYRKIKQYGINIEET